MIKTLLDYFKAYDLEMYLRLMNHFANMMDSLGSLIPQYPFRRVMHLEVITMYKSSLDIPLFNNECPLAPQVNELNVVSKDLWY